MNHFLKKILPFVLLCITLPSFAQKTGRDFKAIDDYVKKLGALDSMNMGTISNLLTKNYDDKTDKVTIEKFEPVVK